MQFRGLVTDDDAVSPVIGVILMVAITVILAAVIGTFVLGLGGTQQETPSVAIEFNFNGAGKVTITHGGGDDLTPSNTQSITVRGASCSVTLPISTGDKFCDTSPATYSDDEILIIWNSADGDQSTPIGSQATP